MALLTPTAISKTKGTAPESSVLLCLSHLRWNFVFQRPQHLLTRAAKTHQVLYFEEPVYEAVARPFMRATEPSTNIRVLTPVLPEGTAASDAVDLQRMLLDNALASLQYDRLVLWYYTPMALPFSDHIDCDVCVYDCMDELSAFKNAPRELLQMERLLMQRADVVFTGGQSIYEAKRRLHKSIYPFPSSIDVAHFHKARRPLNDPADQASIPHPRVGFAGVLDERLDIKLLNEAAAAMPDVQFVMIGPVVKIDPADLPRLPNIHWLGSKSYMELPSYMAGWDAGWMPFALNEATRYISPTKTPEFLAAGLPVVSTAIVDVVRSYGAQGLVQIADSEDIEEKLREALGNPKDLLRNSVDSYLGTMSWDQTWNGMSAQLSRVSRPSIDAAAIRVGA
ncbi:glycosyltransferase family 1 protein [Aestuariivirga sp.]|uniref:glycosyltransferase family 1 protein n=1 Tax=Aestuariivirga sp. TaxID=2650926 RepID=UPI003BABC90D